MSEESWWPVVESIASLVSYGFEFDDLDEDYVRATLDTQGFSLLDIETGMDWLETASLSGNISEVFSLIQHGSLNQTLTTRIANPLEKAFISEEIWSQFEEMRCRGIISNDLAERLLEGVRTMDTRDWEDDDIQMFLEEVISATLPTASDKLIKKILKNRPATELYS